MMRIDLPQVLKTGQQFIFKIKWKNVKWKEMAGMRDRLIHDYMGVNYSIVWDVIINKIPELCARVVKVIENE